MVKTNEPGYVYILTNPSFREDWVKIGKSARPVDIRSKELDNTAVPLPFEIYATIQTVKYNDVEKHVHKTIDRLTDLRIRQNREFFNVPPQIALDIFNDIAKMIHETDPNHPTTTTLASSNVNHIKNIIENYKGTITFETQVAKGTTFIVSLPILK